MIPYYGTPLGGKTCERPAFLLGRHAFISFARPDDLSLAEQVCKSFAFDNGAFTAWRKGEPITDWRPYYVFCRDWILHPAFDFCIIPDVIDGSEAENDIEIARWLNWDGWRKEDRPLRYHATFKSVPVWHLNESIERLVRLAKGHPRIAFGSAGEYARIKTSKWKRKMDEAFNAICYHGRPICKVHGLRMMDPDVFVRYPFSSVDSTNVARNASRESRRHKTSVALAREIIAQRIEAASSPSKAKTRRCEPTLF